MKNEIFDNMLSRYDLTTEQHKRNAIFEVNQQMILAGLYAGGFFESAAFYGGTCLRIFHGLQRFSEDMDFSLLAQDDTFDFTKYFPAIIDAFAMVGREVEIKKKDKKNFGKVESAFLKDNTDVYDVTFQTGKCSLFSLSESDSSKDKRIGEHLPRHILTDRRGAVAYYIVKVLSEPA